MIDGGTVKQNPRGKSRGSLCLEQESNLHALYGHYTLNVARLPIPPSRQEYKYTSTEFRNATPLRSFLESQENRA